MAQQLKDAFDIEPQDCLHVSAKTGESRRRWPVSATHVHAWLGRPSLLSLQSSTVEQKPLVDCMRPYCFTRFLACSVPDPTGLGLKSVLPAVVERIPPPRGEPGGDLKMLLFDAYHDEYR